MNKKEIKKNIEDKILKKISECKIKPKPKWEFVLINVAFWLLGGLVIFLGSMTVTASIFVFRNIRWEFYEATHDNIITFSIEFLPYAWIILFGLFLLMSYHLIKKTKKGYKYDLKIIAGSILSISIILGTLFSILGFGSFIDDKIGNKIPFNRGIVLHNHMIWDKPDQGLLIGSIRKVDNSIVMTDLVGNERELVISFEDQKYVDTIDPNMIFRVVGIQKKDGFYPCIIMPDHGPGPKKVEEEKFFERKIFLERNNECEGILPYRRLLEN